ncbi:alanine racemase [Flavobacteriaceae bacterium]|jgi:alanine racemase|nr:alanine racemase [Flavobacteriaceae bacterium]MDC3246054.1 alanine racemase [Flavobacteriaceae bacterium]
MSVKETTLEIKLENLKENFKFLKSRVSSSTKFMAVVKAFSYGSDSVIISKELEKIGADYLAVAYTNEGIELRENGIRLPILVLHPQEDDFKNIINYSLEPSIYSFRIFTFFLKTLDYNNIKKYPYQIKFNTGLNRLGFLKEDVDKLSPLIKNNPPKYLFSHLGASEDPKEAEYSKNQIIQFQSISNSLETQLNVKLKKHLLNTSGILNYSDYQFDMVRSGIGLYGFGNDIKFKNDLKPILVLKTIISQIHHLTAGDSVGYNLGYTAKSNITIATLPIGHADGIGRIYGKGIGEVLIGKQMAKIVGNVCMDMIMVDISRISCSEGDEVNIFNDDSYTAEEFTTKAGTISYELITSLSRRIKRKIIK